MKQAQIINSSEDMRIWVCITLKYQMAKATLREFCSKPTESNKKTQKITISSLKIRKICYNKLYQRKINGVL